MKGSKCRDPPQPPRTAGRLPGRTHGSPRAACSRRRVERAAHSLPPGRSRSRCASPSGSRPLARLSHTDDNKSAGASRSRGEVCASHSRNGASTHRAGQQRKESSFAAASHCPARAFFSSHVAIQCLETVFKINLEDSHLAVPVRLTEMFADSCHKNETLPLSDSLPEDLEKADQLKDEGNNHMKEENYGAAVDCYTQAIELDPNNAVYYCNRAAAQSKLNNHNEAITDCERAIAIDPKYSKAYGRMGLALTSMNKYQEAINSYRKALHLDPENDSYKSNLKIAEQKLRDTSSPTGTGLSFDMASLINNPAFISMAASLMQNPQVQQLMSGMMTNAIGGPAAGVGGLTDLSSLIHAGQQFAQQIQQQNPELIEQLRNHVRSRSFSGSTEEHS
ncbi:small glutamine-rich tetratricopeptide repeat-containing protein beta isoform X3 [Rhineura floridana]|uniref:small glutamine-rich tetratricopeptide repeat-containing protein beta isoform X3 n=1 Tax=Rhineura floridana TaxID=261503 RepID=UPI002AC81B35|nr:small glutamine-rich tetratricopeptide repeat-containing protein beta isoform X3 [Rhineura floridana]